MALLSKDAIFDVDDREYTVVDMPEWGGEVRLASITGKQRDLYEQSLMQERGGNRERNLANARAKLIVLCAVDESGSPLFTREDVDRLGRRNAKPLDRLFDACRELTGMTTDNVKKLTENFGETQDDGSTSD